MDLQIIAAKEYLHTQEVGHFEEMSDGCCAMCLMLMDSGPMIQGHRQILFCYVYKLWVKGGGRKPLTSPNLCVNALGSWPGWICHIGPIGHHIVPIGYHIKYRPMRCLMGPM